MRVSRDSKHENFLHDCRAQATVNFVAPTCKNARHSEHIKHELQKSKNYALPNQAYKQTTRTVISNSVLN